MRKKMVRLYAVRYDRNSVAMESVGAIKRGKTYRLTRCLQATNGRNVIPTSFPLVAETPQVAVRLFKGAIIKRLEHLREFEPENELMIGVYVAILEGLNNFRTV